MSELAIAIREDLNTIRPTFERINDGSVNFETEAGFAVQALMAQRFTLETAQGNPQSVRDAVTNIAAIGLSLNPAKKQAYLVPRDGKICLDISYIGLLDLAIQSGSIRWGQAELVMETDRFELNGFDKPPTHARNPFKTDRGPVIGAYVVVKTADGDYLTTTMQVDEILSIRDRSTAWKNGKVGRKGPWESDPGEMMKKTVIKRAYKLWPKTDRLDKAIHHLNTTNEEGLDAIDNAPVITEGYSPAKAKRLRESIAAAIQKFEEGNEWGAWEEVSWIDEDEQDGTELKLKLWSVLGRERSAMRASLKKSAAEQRKRNEALEAMPAATEQVEES
jgi:recombination protein RecT